MFNVKINYLCIGMPYGVCEVTMRGNLIHTRTNYRKVRFYIQKLKATKAFSTVAKALKYSNVEMELDMLRQK